MRSLRPRRADELEYRAFVTFVSNDPLDHRVNKKVRPIGPSERR
jgi:hypothetical protein